MICLHKRAKVKAENAGYESVFEENNINKNIEITENITKEDEENGSDT